MLFKNTRLLYLSFVINFSLLFVVQVNAQTSKDDYTGNWTDNNSWVGGTNPGTTGISSSVTIKGFIKHFGDLNFDGGQLFIEDTLIVYGSLVFENISGGGSDPTPVDISINTNGVLIVYGDFSTGNKVDVEVHGWFVATGQFSAQGGSNTVYTNPGGEIFLYNPPETKGGGDFEPLECPTPPNPAYSSGCNYGDSIEASGSPIAPLLGSGGFILSPSGNISLSCGDSVNLSTQSGADGYAWYKDDIVIVGETSNSIYVSENGDYYVIATLGSDSWTTSTTNVSINDVVNPTITCPQNIIVCEGDSINIGTPIVSDNCGVDYTTNNAPASYSIGITTITWEVFDLAGNSSTCNQTVTLNDSPDSGDMHRLPNK